MGNKGGKEKKDKKGEKKPASSGDAAVQKPSVVPAKAAGLTDVDYTFLTTQTGLSNAEIKSLFDKFMSNNPDAKLDKKEFVQLYTQLRPENDQNLDEISEFVFRAFDSGWYVERF
jgi:hypothetical protein